MVASEGNQFEKNKSSQIQVNMGDTNARGGWITLPFIIGSMMGLSLAAGSWYSNLPMFLMRQYNIKEIVATRIYNITSIGVNLLPIVGGVLADSFVGSFLVINLACIASLSGLIMLGLSITMSSLRPHPCNTSATALINLNCDSPSVHQYAFLLVALSLATFGFGCTRFMLCSLGAHQFHKPQHRRIFINVYILAYEVSWAISYAVTAFIVPEKERWAIAFGIGISGNIIAAILLVFGSQYYRHITCEANPCISMSYALGLVIIKKMGTVLAKNNRVYNEQDPNLDFVYAASPDKYIRSVNQANLAETCDDAVQYNTKSWSQRLSTLKEAEDLKKVMKIMPVWSAGILLNTAVATSSKLVILQASAMDLTIGRHIKLPAGSMTVITLIATAITLSVFDTFLYPLWEKVTGRPLKPLQRGGVGHVFVVLGLVGLALVEVGRLGSIKKAYGFLGQGPQVAAPMSAYWLIIPIALLGIGAAYYFPGGLTFNYQEFPKSLKGSSTAMPSIQVGVGFYLSKAFLKVVKHDSSWLPGDINFGRLDLIYLVLALVVAINFGYYLICSTLYKYNIQDSDSESTTSPSNTDKL